MSYYSSIYANDELPHRAKTVYMYLRDRVNGDGNCWPGVKTIGKDLKLSRRTVQRALADLEQAGLVERKPRHRDNGSHTSNLYSVKT
ncbi:helix-turn-helix domain-containing protein [uncultured Oscillibacter sp.]|uniref:helix-turn-helix domain-containing protein n=1 Tax=uncultured Oscillibacter sp. TaxID=876091 RepID=UPI0025E13F5E|nr:helix-turn-helix domain-containing protein [uncultured Oscillibacter sp.]